MPLLAEARKRGVPITVETCAHYLWFAAEEIPDGATEYKCAPPIRSAANREALWKALDEGLIDMVTTDHSPCPPAMKRREEGRWDLAWGGIASLGLGTAGDVDGDAAARRRSLNGWASGWLQLPRGWPAWRDEKARSLPEPMRTLPSSIPDAAWTVTAADLHFRHKLSPYLGAELRGRVRETWLRGEPVFRAGNFIGEARGREQVRLSEPAHRGTAPLAGRRSSKQPVTAVG